MLGSAGGAFITASLVALLGMVVAIPCMMIIKAWLVDAVLDTPIALACLMGILALVGGSWMAQGTVWMLFAVALLLAGCVGIPLWCIRQNSVGLRQLRDEDMDSYRKAIEFDPNNASAYVFLGDALMERGSHIAAAAQYERAVALNPANPAWKRKLQRAQESMQSVAS